MNKEMINALNEEGNKRREGSIRGKAEEEEKWEQEARKGRRN